MDRRITCRRLWELYPDHPNLLAAHFNDPGGMAAWVKKPLGLRESESPVITNTSRFVPHRIG